MLISNSLSKNKIENMGSSNILLRSDGFRKLIKGCNANKMKAEELPSNKLHTSSGFRRYTKQYKLQVDTDGKADCSNQLLPNPSTTTTHQNYRTMTASKQLSRRTNNMQLQSCNNLISSTSNFVLTGNMNTNNSINLNHHNHSHNHNNGVNGNDKKAVKFLKMEQEQQQCFKNVCKMLNVVL